MVLAAVVACYAPGVGIDLSIGFRARLGPNFFFLNPGRGSGRAICFEFRATVGPSRLFLVQGEPRVLDQSPSAN